MTNPNPSPNPHDTSLNTTATSNGAVPIDLDPQPEAETAPPNGKNLDLEDGTPATVQCDNEDQTPRHIGSKCRSTTTITDLSLKSSKNHDDVDKQAKETDNYSISNRSQRSNRNRNNAALQQQRGRRYWFICAVVTLVILAGLAAVLVFVALDVTLPGNSSSSSSGRNGGAFAPSAAISLPTQPPTGPPTTSNPTTPSPTINPVRIQLLEMLARNQIIIPETTTPNPSGKALEWMIDESSDSDTGLVLDVSGNGSIDQDLVQRFALLALEFGLSGTMAAPEETPVLGGTGDNSSSYSLLPPTTFAVWNQDACLWEGVQCDPTTSQVTELHFGSLDLEGSLPTEIGLLSSLRYLDLAQNQLQGRLPESLYGLVELEELFLYQNQFTGTLSSSSSFENWWNLRHLHLSHNQFTGTIPQALASGNETREFNYINLSNNQLTGTIPTNLRWQRLFYFDLGHNQLTGTLPADLGESFISLRHLHLDHNQFRGQLPLSYVTVGNGRLEQLTINDNRLTGQVPDNHVMFNKLVMFTMEDNDFSSDLDKTCRLSVYEGGENVEMKADCDICSCQGNFFCATC